MSEVDLNRRDFLTKSAAAAGVVVAPGILLHEVAQARPEGEPASSKVRWGMLVDTTRCQTGCNECVSACDKENGLSGAKHATDSQWIRKVELKDMRSGRQISLPMMCQHCAEPPCVDVCPTNASMKRADGIVQVDRHRCIGCRYCMMACPYKARSFVHEPVEFHLTDAPRGQGTVESCNLCVARVDRGEQPACVEACAKAGHAAILFGNLNDPDSDIAKRLKEVSSTRIRADLNLDTGIHYQGI